MDVNLRTLLELNNLVEKNGKWYYPPYSMYSWIVLTYDNGVRFIEGFNLTKDNKINDYGFSVIFKSTEYKFIDRIVKKLIKEFNQLVRLQKERKAQEKFDDIKKDFV